MSSDDWDWYRGVRDFDAQQKAEKRETNTKEILELPADKYTVRKISDYLYRINEKIDVWPTSGKAKLVGKGGKGRYYKAGSLRETLDGMFDKLRGVEKEKMYKLVYFNPFPRIDRVISDKPVPRAICEQQKIDAKATGQYNAGVLHILDAKEAKPSKPNSVKNVAMSTSNSNSLNDKSPMPWGKHKGKAMVDVPDHYFKWLYENTEVSGPVLRYIEDNAQALKIQLKKK